jgi:hypothetical protein
MRIMRIGSTALNLDQMIAMEFEERDEGCLIIFETEHCVKTVMVPEVTEEEVLTAMMDKIHRGDCGVDRKHFDLMAEISKGRNHIDTN